MSDRLPSPSGSGARAPAPDERGRELGLQLVTMLSGVIRIGRAYSASNPLFRTQLANLTAVLRLILEQSGELSLVAANGELQLNGVRLAPSALGQRFHQTVIESFTSRGISGLRAERGIGVEDLVRFSALFLNPSCPHGSALLKACADSGLTRILPALNASTATGAGDPARWEALAGFVPLIGWQPASTESGHGDPNEASPRDAARQSYALALERACGLLATTATSAGLEMRHVKRVVQPLVDGALSLEPIVIGLSRPGKPDRAAHVHAVNVCAVAVTMGHGLGMDRKSLADLGVAALLHDIGKGAMAAEIIHPLEAFTEEERVAAERHPIEGAKLLVCASTLNSTTLLCIRVALEHHRGTDGETGYPALPREWLTSMMAQTVAVADCYVNLHLRQDDLVENITPYQALGMMLGPLGQRFEPALLWALIHSVGFYPPGQRVELSDGSVARVLAPHPDDPARPHVRVESIPGARGEAKEWLPVPFYMSVRRALPGEEYPDEAMRAA